MIFIMVFLGILTVLAGVLPLLAAYKINILPALFTTGWVYAAIVSVIGLVGIIYALNPMAMGAQGISKFLIGVLGVLTIFGGVLPFLASFIKFIPAVLLTNPIYSIIIIVLGLVGLGYGATQMM